MADKPAAVQVHKIYIKAKAQAIWDAITKPEWSEKYAYSGRVSYELKKGGTYYHEGTPHMKAMGLPDKIILGKALGVGLYGAAVKKQQETESQYRELIASTTQLNTPGIHLAQKAGVHALTDVTGFGLLGHLLEVCRGSAVHARVQWSAVPLLADARTLASTGFVTGGSARNWKSYGSFVDLTTHGAVEQAILTDPQTSGGLLVACAPDVVDDVMDRFRREGFQRAAVIGEIEEGSPAVTVV